MVKRKQLDKVVNIDAILKERGGNYGDFAVQGDCAQSLKSIVDNSPNVLEPFQKEALHMILHKISRIICGDPTYLDSWDDIAGYAQLASNTMRRDS